MFDVAIEVDKVSDGDMKKIKKMLEEMLRNEDLDPIEREEVEVELEEIRAWERRKKIWE